jgi:hypothetical protein
LTFVYLCGHVDKADRFNCVTRASLIPSPIPLDLFIVDRKFSMQYFERSV